MIFAVALAIGQDTADAEIRRIVLSDGQEFVVEVVATEETGLRGRIPQGTRLFSFDDLVDLSPTSVAEFDAQPAWPVALTADEAITPVAKAALNLVPALAVASVADLQAGLRAQIEACTSRPDAEACTARAIGPSGFAATAARRDTDLWLSVTDFSGNKREIQFGDVFPEEGVEGGAEAAAAQISADISPLFALDRSRPSDARLAALSEALAPFHVVRMDTRGLSWVPIPGLAAFAEGRPAAGGAALAGAVVGTAAWVSVLGKTTPTVAEHAGLGAVGAVVISLVANQIAAAPGGANAASAVIAPLQGGAAMVIGARF